MDKKEFRAKLDELAVIKDIQPIKLTGRPKKRIVQMEDDFGEMVEMEVEDIEPTTNPTLGIQLVEVKHPPRFCELGCGRMVEGQVVQTHFVTYPVAHKRIKCLNCGKYQHPSGEGIITGAHSTAAVYNRYYARKR